MQTPNCRLQNRVRLGSGYEHLTNNIFLRDLGSAMAITECQKVALPLASNETDCFYDFKLANKMGFLDRESFVIKNSSSKRPCNNPFPQNIIVTTKKLFLAFEPVPMIIDVQRNLSLLGELNFGFNDNNTVQFIDNTDGLLTSSK